VFVAWVRDCSGCTCQLLCGDVVRKSSSSTVDVVLWQGGLIIFVEFVVSVIITHLSKDTVSDI
jgi:hypothetical protein